MPIKRRDRTGHIARHGTIKELLECVKATKGKHIPSGVILAWIGNDDRIHTKSIPAPKCPHFSADGKRILTENKARTNLLLLQLDYLGLHKIKSMPIMITGLTRNEAKAVAKKELLEIGYHIGCFIKLQTACPKPYKEQG